MVPYNNIAKKNRARLDQLAAGPRPVDPAPAKQTKNTAGAQQIFIEESGESGATVLRNTAGKKVVAHISPSDQAVLYPDKNAVTVRTLDEQLLGQVEHKLALGRPG